uniref:DUF834 domain-containing protein n=1 Tax=Oryza glumipatula TaxID=40148 RepID=A0A0D9YH16_9ORYZ
MKTGDECGGDGGWGRSRLRGGLGKTSPPVQCAVAAAAEGDDLVGSGGLRRRRRMGKTLSPAAADGNDAGSDRRMGTTSAPAAADGEAPAVAGEDLASGSVHGSGGGRVRSGGGRGRRCKERAAH